MGGGDDQYVADPCQHQGAERVVDHRLVVYRHQLLAHCCGERRQTAAAAASEDDASARHQIGFIYAGVISTWKSCFFVELGRLRTALVLRPFTGLGKSWQNFRYLHLRWLSHTPVLCGFSNHFVFKTGTQVERVAPNCPTFTRAK